MLLGASAATRPPAPAAQASPAGPEARRERAGPAGAVLSPVASIPQLAAGVTFRKVSKRAVSAATLTYVSHARGPLQVRVDVVRLADGYSVFTDERTSRPKRRRR